MPRTRPIADDVRDALATLAWDGLTARLTCGQLDRRLYSKVNDALESFGGKWDRRAKGHVFSYGGRELLADALAKGSYASAKDVRQEHGEFFTPDALADELVQLADIGPGMRVLEPSAGDGALLRAIARRHGDSMLQRCVAVEIQQKHEAALRQLKCSVRIGDFLGFSLAALTPMTEMDFGRLEKPIAFDRVIANPPFGNQRDVQHVLHAWKLLRPGGRLVSIMANGFTFRCNKASIEFREFVERYGRWEENPEGSFQGAGTLVRSVTIVLDKPKRVVMRPPAWIRDRLPNPDAPPTLDTPDNWMKRWGKYREANAQRQKAAK